MIGLSYGARKVLSYTRHKMLKSPSIQRQTYHPIKTLASCLPEYNGAGFWLTELTFRRRWQRGKLPAINRPTHSPPLTAILHASGGARSARDTFPSAGP